MRRRRNRYTDHDIQRLEESCRRTIERQRYYLEEVKHVCRIFGIRESARPPNQRHRPTHHTT